MRFLSLAAMAGALCIAVLPLTREAARADKSRMGCDTITEVWDAALGKCQAGTPKYKRAAAEPAMPAEVKPAPKKAPAKKAKTAGKAKNAAAAAKKAGPANVPPPSGPPAAAKAAPAQAK